MEEGHGHWREKHLFRSWFYSVKCTVFVMLKYPFQSQARFQLRPVHAKSGVGGSSLGQVSKSSKVHRQQFTGQKWKQEKYRSRNYSAHSDNRWSRLRLLCHFQWHGDFFWYLYCVWGPTYLLFEGVGCVVDCGNAIVGNNHHIQYFPKIAPP